MAKIRRSCSWLIVGQLDLVIEKLHLFDQKHILFVNIHLLVFDDTFETSTTRKKRLLVWPERLPQQWQRHSAVLGKAATCNMPPFSAKVEEGGSNQAGTQDYQPYPRMIAEESSQQHTKSWTPFSQYFLGLLVEQ